MASYSYTYICKHTIIDHNRITCGAVMIGVTDRPGHDLRYAIDPTKLETELGWKPKYTFETGIKQTIQWYLDNKEWWQNIISGEYANYFDKMYGKELAE